MKEMRVFIARSSSGTPDMCEEKPKRFKCLGSVKGWYFHVSFDTNSWIIDSSLYPEVKKGQCKLATIKIKG